MSHPFSDITIPHPEIKFYYGGEWWKVSPNGNLYNSSLENGIYKRWSFDWVQAVKSMFDSDPDREVSGFLESYLRELKKQPLHPADLY